MKPLQEIHWIFVILGICPPSKPIGRWLKIFNNSFSIFCLTILFIASISSSIYFIKYFSIDLLSAICAVYQIVGAVISIYTLITAHVKYLDIKKIFNDIQTFYNASK